MTKRNIIFFDAETNREKSIVDLGALSWADGAIFHAARVAGLQRFVRDHGGESALIAGHNVFDFDIPIVAPLTDFASRHLIDTLYLSALLFPQERFHALLKDERLRADELSNPLSDAKKARNLFELECSAFGELPPAVRQVLCDLLAGTRPFGGFFLYMEMSVSAPGAEDLASRIRKAWRGAVCENADLDFWISSSPMDLAFALAFLASKVPVDAIPAWVQKKMPGVQRVLNALCHTACQKGCVYCQSRLNLHAGLKAWFGFDGFRTYAGEPLQEKAASAALRGDSLLAVFPTGGGKSLTFQLPALMAGENVRGLTVVISPLQSLMKDQVDHLKAKGIEGAEAINGLQDPLTRRDVLEAVQSGRVRLLYLAPEQLRSKTIFKILSGRYIERFVIDEAHCFSAWGHDFRVDYLYIAGFMKALAKKQQRDEPIPVSCFTATAKQKVIQDICDYFRQELNLSLRLFTTDAARVNLRYQVVHVEDETEKYPRLRELLTTRICPTIVYVSTVKKTEELCERLCSDGFDCCAFNGRMDPDEKVAAQEDFLLDRVRIMVATNAFGMGVDKADVGLVVHYEIAGSLENYVQEAGRAGRDESLEAECFVLFHEDDLDKHFQLHNRSKLTLSDIQKVWQAVKRRTAGGQRHVLVSAYDLASDTEAGFSEGALADEAGSVRDKETRVRTALAVLEEAGYLRRGLNAPRIFATSLKVKNLGEARKKIESAPCFASQSENKRQLALRIMSRLISAAHTKVLHEEEASARTDYLADTLGVEHSDVVDCVRLLREVGAVADEVDIAARYNFSKRNASKVAVFHEAEVFLGNWIAAHGESYHDRFNLKDLYERLRERHLDVTPMIVRRLLRQWEREKSVAIGFLDRDTRRIRFKVQPDVLERRARQRLALCGHLLEQLELLGEPAPKTGSPVEVKLSIVGLMRSFKATLDDVFEPTQRQMEHSLLFLKDLKIVEFESGFLVNYPALRIERLVMDNRKRFTKTDYRRLDEFYQQKIQQIHIVGEYANLMVKNIAKAMRYVSDYFAMEYGAFVKKYFAGEREKTISVNMTRRLYERIYGALSPRQMEVIKDRSQYIVVCAGPGSGKTRVLVHKLASLLIEEDVKSEELLMLTFSRAAATEFAVRLRALLGGGARFVEIRTFHSFCFDILGRRGVLSESDNVVAEAVARIRAGEVEASRIAKTVLVLDEAQDMDASEFALVEALLGQNETMRVIAVGDDDQNIYAFRGSSSEHFRKLLTTYEASHHLLLDNYRSTPEVVALSNAWVRQLPNRLKTDDGRAVRSSDGFVKVIAHRMGRIVGPAVEDLLRDFPKGKTAVLTRTNEEAREVCGRLLCKGVPARLIQEEKHVPPALVRELHRVLDYFRRLLAKQDKTNIISDAQWSSMMRHLKEQCSQSAVYDRCAALLNKFNSSVMGGRYLSDLETYLWESDLDDGLETDQETILVSTIHKAKGGEFDNVCLVLGNRGMEEEPYLREVFVGITRAKTRLRIHHGPGAFLPHAQLAGLAFVECSDETRLWPLAEVLQMSLGHDGLFLDYFISRQRLIEKLHSGQKLIPRDFELFCRTEGGGEASVARFSKKAREDIASILAGGYVMSEASVRVMVYWRKKDSDADTLILLPDLVFRRRE